MLCANSLGGSLDSLLSPCATARSCADATRQVQPEQTPTRMRTPKVAPASQGSLFHSGLSLLSLPLPCSVFCFWVSFVCVYRLGRNVSIDAIYSVPYQPSWGSARSSKACSHPRLFFFRRFHEKCFSCFFTTRVDLNKRNQHPFRF